MPASSRAPADNGNGLQRTESSPQTMHQFQQTWTWWCHLQPVLRSGVTKPSAVWIVASARSLCSPHRRRQNSGNFQQELGKVCLLIRVSFVYTGFCLPLTKCQQASYDTHKAKNDPIQGLGDPRALPKFLVPKPVNSKPEPLCPSRGPLQFS